MEILLVKSPERYTNVVNGEEGRQLIERPRPVESVRY